MNILPVFLPHCGCPFRCIYCNQTAIAASAPPDWNDFLPRLQAFCAAPHTIPRQVAFYGGTFTALPQDAQDLWLNRLFHFLPHLDGLRLSTRPDCVDEAGLARLRERGVRTVELGVQSFSDDELTASERGYGAATALAACRLVQEAGLELGVQLMPGLPGRTATGWEETLAATVGIKPSFVRLYPLLVLRGTALERKWHDGAYNPLEKEEAVLLCANTAERLEAAGVTVAKCGLHGSLAPQDVIAGPWRPDFGEAVMRARWLLRLPAEWPQGCALVVSPRDVSLLRGDGGMLLNEMRARYSLPAIPFFIDSAQPKGYFRWEKDQRS